MKPPSFPNIDAAVSQVRPRGDMILVRRIDEPIGLRAPASVLIAAPDHVLNARGQMRKRDDTAPRRGVVVAVGLGDRIFILSCGSCGQFRWRTELARRWRCECGGELWRSTSTRERTEPSDRCPMHVKPGDEIFYEFWAGNRVMIGGEEYQFLHEEQSVVCVIEPDGADSAAWMRERNMVAA